MSRRQDHPETSKRNLRRALTAGALLVALLVALLPAPGCARRYTVKSALLSSASLRADECRSGEAIDTGEKDCDGLPIYELRCPGRPPISGAIWCHKGDCFVQQMAGRCWK